MEVLMKRCTVLDCNIGDIVKLVKDEDSESDCKQSREDADNR